MAFYALFGCGRWGEAVINVPRAMAERRQIADLVVESNDLFDLALKISKTQLPLTLKIQFFLKIVSFFADIVPETLITSKFNRLCQHVHLEKELCLLRFVFLLTLLRKLTLSEGSYLLVKVFHIHNFFKV